MRLKIKGIKESFLYILVLERHEDIFIVRGYFYKCGSLKCQHCSSHMGRYILDFSSIFKVTPQIFLDNTAALNHLLGLSNLSYVVNKNF